MSAPATRKCINNYSYRLTDTIGEGFSSQVYSALDQTTKRPVAVKVVAKLPHKTQEQLELAENEIHALTRLQGKDNILELKHALQTKNSIYIVTELCPSGTLRTLLERDRKLPQPAATKLIQQVINGYRSIHQAGLVHRDLKPDNIFLDAHGHPKIGDFGFAIPVEKCREPLKENLGSPLFMSPEALTRNMYSFKSDIWAIGVTFYEMLVGRVPWQSKTEKELVTEIQSFSVEAILPKDLSHSNQLFLRRTMQKNVEERMSPEELFSFKFQSSQTQIGSVTDSPHQLRKKSSLEVICEQQEEAEKLGSSAKAKTPLRKENSESTDEHSKRNLEKIGEIEGPETSPESPELRMTASLNLEQPEITASKAKGRLNRKYSEIKDKEEMHHFALPEQLAPPPLFHNKSETSPQVKLPAKLERQILLQIQSQINYFRFCFKLFKRLHETLKTTDDHIRSLKHSLLFLTHRKMAEIKDLTYLREKEGVKEAFKASAEYANLLQVISQYEERYLKEEERTGVKPAYDEEKTLFEQLTYTLKVLHQNLAKIEANVQQFHRKKGLVFIIEDLLELSKLHLMDRSHDWLAFHRESNVQKSLERPQFEGELLDHWTDIKAELRRLITI